MKIILFLLCFFFLSCGPFSATLENMDSAPFSAEKAEPAPTASLSNDMILPAASRDLIYFNQTDERWAEKNYGPQNCIAAYGCGPTVLSMLVSTFTEETIPPDEMAEWCYENGFFSQNSGSYHSIIPEGANAWGLDARSLKDLSYRSMLNELYAGRLIVMLMGEGHFTSGGHFIIIRNVTLEGDLLIADPNSIDNSLSPWAYELIRSEIKPSNDAGGPVWSIGK